MIDPNIQCKDTRIWSRRNIKKTQKNQLQQALINTQPYKRFVIQIKLRSVCFVSRIIFFYTVVPWKHKHKAQPKHIQHTQGNTNMYALRDHNTLLFPYYDFYFVIQAIFLHQIVIIKLGNIWKFLIKSLFITSLIFGLKRRNFISLLIRLCQLHIW